MAIPFSGKGLAPHLRVDDPDVAGACTSVTSLFVNMRNAKKELDAAGHVLGPLLALLPLDGRAAGPLATMAVCMVRGAAYPEAIACIDAVIDRTSDAPIGTVERPWQYHGTEPMTWPRQQALLWLMRGECRLASGDREGGEAALAEGATRAKTAELPPYFGLRFRTHDTEQGTVADHRLLALVHGARALRLRFEGHDPSPHRKVKKSKKPAPPDRAQLTLARTYLDDALHVIGPRVAEQYAGLVPQPQFEHPDLTRAQKDASWQKLAYFESALVDEHLGDLDRARLHLGRSKWISALREPTHHWEGPLREAVARLGVENTPLA